MDLANSLRKPLSELIGNFGYTGPAETRQLSGEIVIKRRRIELQDPATTSVLARKPSKKAVDEGAPGKPKKRNKPPAKKPRTVTEAATAAYHPPPAPAEASVTASKFFVPENPAAEKPKEPRKPRTKAAEGSTIAPKKPGRSKKPKVTVPETVLPSLLSPQHAIQQAEQQSFLFGTSSQLAAEESPTFIRQMQAAIIDSGLVPSAQAMEISPARVSCAKVPTAPHGTSLSVGQAENEHWRVASRDWNGGLLREKSGLKVRKKLASVTAPVFQPTDSYSEPPEVTPAPQTTPTYTPVEQQQPLSAEDADSFINIDDISDHEPRPTPSPPRRKASASPVSIQPLAFHTVSPSAARARMEQPAKKLLATNAALKPTDAQWPLIKVQLFPHVTGAVKAAARSTDPAKPSWHQKILLYDPIVLEDLTECLNAQDLRVSVQRQKAKKGAKARKKKDTEGSAEEASRSVPEMEEVKEALQPWMIQKWCEEKSVCCLWKEGLRGGVRSNY